MTDTNTLSLQQQRQQQIMMHAQQQQIQMMATQQQQQQQQQQQHDMKVGPPFQFQSQTMGTPHDDIPLQPADTIFTSSGIHDSKSVMKDSYETACKTGSLSTVQSIITSSPQTPYFLNHGLHLALQTGNVQIARYLLSVGAPIARITANQILSAPPPSQISLFELLFENGWTPNDPGFYGSVLLPEIVSRGDISLVRWFLSHGADPNLGPRSQSKHDDDTAHDFSHSRFAAPSSNSCIALETAAAKSNIEIVQLLLDSGAKIEYGYPLHYAAGACPDGTNPFSGPISPGREFDRGRIPIMECLIRYGGKEMINTKEEERYMGAGYPIIHAVMAGAVERVRWLLENGADPELKGAYGSAVSYVEAMGCSEEMKRVVEEGAKARRWLD